MANMRLPDNVHRLNGTYQPCRHGDDAEKPDWDESLPEMPQAVAERPEAAKVWEWAIGAAPRGVITKTDQGLLAQYALLAATLYASPETFSASDHTQFRLIQQELGFTPASRGKITGPKQGEKESGFE